MLAEAPDVHAPEVQRRLAADDPLGHHLADAAGARQAVRAEAGGHEQPAHRGLAEAELAVGRERLGPLISRVTRTSSKSGTRLRALTTISSKRSQSSSSRRPLKSGGMASSATPPSPIDHGAQRALVAAHHEAAALLAEVDLQVRVAQRRQVALAAAERLRDHVLVLHRHDRDPHAGQAPDLGREHAAGVDDDLGVDRPRARCTRAARGRGRTSIPVTRVLVKIRQPPRRAPSASALVSWLGSR